MTLFDQAKQELQLLESHWISLLASLAQKTRVTPDNLVRPRRDLALGEPRAAVPSNRTEVC